MRSLETLKKDFVIENEELEKSAKSHASKSKGKSAKRSKSRQGGNCVINLSKYLSNANQKPDKDSVPEFNLNSIE